MITKKWVVPLFIVFCVVGVVLLVLGIVYLTMHAADLPSWLPGHVTARITKKGKTLPTSAHTKRGLIAIVLATVSFIGAWWVLFRYKPAE